MTADLNVLGKVFSNNTLDGDPDNVLATKRFVLDKTVPVPLVLTGTADQISVTGGGSNFQLSLPQNIDVRANARVQTIRASNTADTAYSRLTTMGFEVVKGPGMGNGFSLTKAHGRPYAEFNSPLRLPSSLEVDGGGVMFLDGAECFLGLDAFDVLGGPSKAFRLHVEGPAFCSVSSMFAFSSDRRLKTDIDLADGGVMLDAVVNRLKLYRFEWNDGRKRYDQKQIGFMADDFEKVFPHSVMTSETPVHLKDGRVIEQSKTIDIGQAFFLLFGAFQEHVRLTRDTLEPRMIAVEAAQESSRGMVDVNDPALRDLMRNVVSGGKTVPDDIDWTPCTKVAGSGVIEARLLNGTIRLRGEVVITVTAVGSFTRVAMLPQGFPAPPRAQHSMVFGQEAQVSYRRVWCQIDSNGAVSISGDGKITSADLTGAEAYAF